MSKRKLLYGYQIQNGELTVVEAEASVVARVASLYLEGLSYQKLADLLNPVSYTHLTLPTIA